MNALLFRYSARLIQSLGGRFGSGNPAQHASQDSEIRFGQMTGYTMNDVRNVLDRLIQGGQDEREPIALGQQKIFQCREVTMILLKRIYSKREITQSTSLYVDECISDIIALVQFLHQKFVPLLSLIPFNSSKSGSALISEFESIFESFMKAESTVEISHQHGHFEEGDNQDLAIDSDEEERLFDELDQLMEAQERAEAFRGNAHKFMANSMQRAFRMIEELETGFQTVRVLNQFC